MISENKLLWEEYIFQSRIIPKAHENVLCEFILPGYLLLLGLYVSGQKLKLKYQQIAGRKNYWFCKLCILNTSNLEINVSGFVMKCQNH